MRLGRSASQAAAAAFEHALAALQQLPETRLSMQDAVDLHLSARACWTGIGDFTRGLEHTRSAERIATRLEDPVRLGWAWGALSVACYCAGDMEEGIAQALRADAICASSDDRVLRVAVGFCPGLVYTYAGRYAEGVDACRRCVATITTHETEHAGRRGAGTRVVYAQSPAFLYCFAQGHAAMCLAELGRFDEAIRCGEDGVRRAERMDQAHPLGYVGAKLGFAYLNKGEFAQALTVLERAVQVARRSETYIVLMAVGSRIGHAYKTTGRIQEAVAALEEARDLAQGGQNLAQLPRIVAHLADAYSLAGRTDEALQSGRLAVDLAHAHGMLGYEVWALYLLGEIYARIQGQRDAVQLLSQALPLAEGRGMPPVAAHCHLGLSKLYAKTGRRDKALEHVTIAATMYREMDMGFWLQKAEAEMRGLA